MTGILKVDTAKLTSTADSFQGTGNDIKALTDSMMDTVRQLTGEVWSGDAATAYVTKFNNLQDDITRMIGMVNEHVEDLKAMARGYEQAEQANQDLANALRDDVIQ